MRLTPTDALRDERRLAYVSAAVLGMMTAAVLLGTPGHAAWLPPCPLHAITGLFCPGCGATRALYLLVHGYPLSALRENVLAVLSLPFVVYELGAVLTKRFHPLSPRLRPWSLWSLVAIVILFAVLRNLPCFPFTILAPTDLP